MKVIRFGLQCHFMKKYVDIIHHSNFANLKKAFESMTMSKRKAKASSKHRSSISTKGVKIIQESFDSVDLYPQRLQDNNY